MGENLTLSDVFNRTSIYLRAKEHWDFKCVKERLRCGKKYSHIFGDKDSSLVDWSNPFESLSLKQKKLIIKGELIRTYDSLPNIDKTYIKNKFRLSVFSSKWYKLPNADKNKLIKKLT